MKRKIICMFLSVAMIGLLCVSLTACGTETISLNDYVGIYMKGCNGYGTAEYKIKENKLRNDFKDVEFTTKGKDSDVYDIYGITPVEGLIYMLVDKGSLECDNGKLSNGDTIEYKWTLTDEDVEDIKEIFNVDLKYSDFEYTVEDLEEAEKEDIFNEIEIEFYGVGPNGTAILKTDNSDMGTTDFTVEPRTGLSEGDKVTVSLTKDDDYYISTYGKMPEEREKVYTVNGLKSYITELSQIPDDGLDELKEKTEEVIYKQNEKMDEDEYQEIEFVKYLGCYLLVPKEDISTTVETYNSIYTVYQVDVILHNKEMDGEDSNTYFTYYFYCRFTNAMVENGFLNVDTSIYETPEFYNVEIVKTVYDDTKYENGQNITLTYYGYEDLDDLFNDVVESRLDLYDYESSVED